MGLRSVFSPAIGHIYSNEPLPFMVAALCRHIPVGQSEPVWSDALYKDRVPVRGGSFRQVGEPTSLLTQSIGEGFYKQLCAEEGS